jgi:transposase
VQTLDCLLSIVTRPGRCPHATCPGSRVRLLSAKTQPMRLEVVKLPEAKKGCVLLPRRWVVEWSNAWATRFRRLARDDERLAETLAGLHFVACAILLLKRFVELVLSNA